MIFKASRLSSGNKMFPVEVELKETALEIKEPGLLNSVETNYDYAFIQNIIVNDPLIGYCSFSFEYKGKRIEVNGFKEDDMEEIERLLDNKLKEFHTNSKS